MSDPGWTLGDLAGELWARGIEIDNVDYDEMAMAMRCHRVEVAAERIASGRACAAPLRHREGCECSQCDQSRG